jgi:hypothetical protein
VMEGGSSYNNLNAFLEKIEWWREVLHLDL